MNLKFKTVSIALSCLFATASVQAASLYGHAGYYGPEGETGTLYYIDTTSQTVTAIGGSADRLYGPEIQSNPQLTTVYFSTVGWSDSDNPYPASLLSINPGNGSTTQVVPYSNLPAGRDVTATALEFVGNTLYGAFHESGPETDDGVLGTINPATGVVTEIGTMTGMDTPAGGMHYVNGKMYAISAANTNLSSLFTVNLDTGATTVVAPLTLNGQPVDSSTGLVYADGKMYLVLNRDSNLYSVNLATGELTIEFDMGLTMNSLTVGALNLPRAAFPVTKTFSDGSTYDVDVTLTCTTGLPLTQPATITGGDPTGVTFVVTDIVGNVDCEVTESGSPAGYTPVYNGGAGCSWSNNELTAVNTCAISNTAKPGNFTANMEWNVVNEDGDDTNEAAAVTITCDSAIVGGTESGSYWTLTSVLSDGGSLTATVNTTTGPASCWATQSITASAVESTDDCGARPITAGGSSSCTFVNTVFFEGVPTLSQYGLAILALLMLGVGFIGMRRFA